MYSDKPHKPPLMQYAGRYLKEGILSKYHNQKPLFLTVFVTARCGLNCGHCFYREELLNGNISDELSLDEFEQITQNSPPFPKLIITGGEPFLRTDLNEITTLFYENNSRARQITIPTAGQHTDRIVSLVNELLPSRPDLILEIQLSIDGVGDNHDSIRGKGQFERLMQTYRALEPIQSRNQGLRIRFNYTFSRRTQDWFEETHQFVTQTLGNPHFDMVLVRRMTIDDDFWGKVDLKKYRHAAELLQTQEKKKAGKNLFAQLLTERVQVEREIIAKHHVGERVMSGCQAGTLTAIISETGEVRPCEILDTNLGNLRDNGYDFMRIWKNMEADAHRKRIHQNKCFCTFETCVRTTMSFQPKWGLSMMKNFITQRLRL
jgi:MoaA/NifB/PqqE/SkfB family radical SAM enzyme